MANVKVVMKRKLAIWTVIIAMLILIALLCAVSQEKSKVTNSVNIENECYENTIAITFDDGPRRNTTEKLLDGLRERGVKATFFLIGKNIVGNEDVVVQMKQDGHLIGNHTYTHIELSTITHAAAIDEVTKTNEQIYEITGYTPQYIRPPFGSYTSRMQLEINMSEVMWTIDPNDWNTTNVNDVVNSVVKNAKGGDIILMHDIYDSSVVAALEIIDRLQAKGFVFVTVDQLILD